MNPTDACKQVVDYLSPFLDALQEPSMMPQDQERLRLKLKNSFLKILMQHYGNYRISPEGARIILNTDLDYFKKNILCYNLYGVDAENEMEQCQTGYELLE